MAKPGSEIKEKEKEEKEREREAAKQKEQKEKEALAKEAREREEEIRSRKELEQRLKEEAPKRKEELQKEAQEAEKAKEAAKIQAEADMEALKKVPPTPLQTKPGSEKIEIEARMAALEAEMERLKRERFVFEQERKRFEEEKKAFEASKQQAANQAPKENSGPERNTPAAGANQPAGKGNPAGAPQPEKDAVVNRKGNYTEMKLGDSSLTQKQADQAAALKITADMSVLAKKSSKEFKMMQAAVERFDKFMKGMNGRTAFTPEELEKYDRLSHDVYKASDTYLKKKQDEMDQRPVGKDGKTKNQSKYEYARIKAAEEIRETVEQMRQEMLDKAFKEKLNEMEQRCADQLKNLDQSREKLASNKDMDPDRKRSQLEDNTAHSIFYANCMRNLSGKRELCMKPGESMNAAVNRISASMIPEKKEIENIKAHPVVQNIVENGSRMISEGKAFTYNDMNKMVKKEAARKAPEIEKAKKQKAEQARKGPEREAARQAKKKPENEAARQAKKGQQPVRHINQPKAKPVAARI